MPIRFEVDRAAGMTHTIVDGVFTVSDLRRHLALMLDGKIYRFPGLIDARNAEEISWRPKDLLVMARLVGDGLSRRSVAPSAVVVSKDSHFAQARAFASYVAGWMRLAIFQDIESAEAWLADVDVPAPSRSPGS